MLEEFKKFAMRGNVVDMAVGIVIGAAFGKIVSSFVSTEYTSLAAAEEAGAAVIRYGAFINTILDFLIVAFAIFMVIRGMNKLKKAEEEAPPPAPPEPSAEEKLLTEIRDALKAPR